MKMILILVEKLHISVVEHFLCYSQIIPFYNYSLEQLFVTGC